MADKATKTKDKAKETATGRPEKSSNPELYRLRKRYKSEFIPQLMSER